MSLIKGEGHSSGRATCSPGKSLFWPVLHLSPFESATSCRAAGIVTTKIFCRVLTASLRRGSAVTKRRTVFPRPVTRRRNGRNGRLRPCRNRFLGPRAFPLSPGIFTGGVSDTAVFGIDRPPDVQLWRNHGALGAVLSRRDAERFHPVEIASRFSRFLLRRLKDFLLSGDTFLRTRNVPWIVTEHVLPWRRQVDQLHWKFGNVRTH